MYREEGEEGVGGWSRMDGLKEDKGGVGRYGARKSRGGIHICTVQKHTSSRIQTLHPPPRKEGERGSGTRDNYVSGGVVVPGPLPPLRVGD